MQPYMQPTGTKPFNSLSVRPFFFLPLHYIHSYPLTNKQTHSFMSVFLLLILLLLLLMSELEFFSFCAHSLLLSIFPLFSVTHICIHQEFSIIPCSTVVRMIHKVTYGLCSAAGVSHSCFTKIIYVVTDLSHVLPVTRHSVYAALHDFLSLLHLWYTFLPNSSSLYKRSNWKYCHFCSFSFTVVLRTGAK